MKLVILDFCEFYHRMEVKNLRTIIFVTLTRVQDHQKIFSIATENEYIIFEGMDP